MSDDKIAPVLDIRAEGVGRHDCPDCEGEGSVDVYREDGTEGTDDCYCTQGNPNPVVLACVGGCGNMTAERYIKKSGNTAPLCESCKERLHGLRRTR